MFRCFFSRFDSKKTFVVFKSIRKKQFSSSFYYYCPKYLSDIAKNCSEDSKCDPQRFPSWRNIKLEKVDETWEDKGDFSFLRFQRNQNIENVLITFISDHRNERISSQKWADMRSDCIKIIGSKGERFVDSNLLMAFISKDIPMETALSYVEYLTNENLLNTATIRIAAELIFQAFVLKILPVDDPLIFRFLKNIIANSNRFGETVETPKLFCTFCTSNWKDSLNSLSNSQFKSSRMANSRAAVVCFINDEPELGLNILRRFLEEKTHHFLTKPVFNELLNCLTRMALTYERRCLKCFKEFILVCQEYNSFGFHFNLESKLQRLFKNLKSFTVNKTLLTKGGQCKFCLENLEDISVNKEEFDVLQNVILNDAVIGNDVFRSSTPQEVAKFKKFLNIHKPFDVVIDGMNVVSYQNSNKHIGFERLNNLLDDFKSKKLSNICVTLRKHVYKTHPWLFDLQSKAHIFWMDNISTDDCFLLYAAAVSGPKCYIVSNDHFHFLRKFFNTDDRIYLLEKWKRSRLITLTFSRSRVFASFPHRYALRAQTSASGFHLPLVEPGLDSTAIENGWLCVIRNESDKPTQHSEKI